MSKFKPYEIQQSIYKNMSYSQKWGEFLKLRKAAWDIKSAAVRAQHPDWQETQVQKKVTSIFLYATT